MAEDIEDVLAGRTARHRAEWSAPARAESEPGTVADTDDPLAFLQSELGLTNTNTIAGSAARALMPTVELPRPRARAEVPVEIAHADTSDLAPEACPPAARAGADQRPRASWLAAAALLMATVAMGFSARPLDSASATPTVSGPAPALPAAVVASVTEAPRAPAPDVARLAIAVDHSLKQGRLRLWVDGTLRLERTLGRRDVTKVASRPRGGSARSIIDLEPGVHDVRVQIAWDDNVRTEHVRGTFRPGDRRVLAARLRGFFRRSLSLHWQ